MKSLYTLLFVMLSVSIFAQEIEVPQTQRSLITKRTATWCSVCGGYAWDMMESFVDNHSDRAIVLNAHHSSSSNFHADVAQELVDNLQEAFGQPTFYVNNERIGSGNTNTENTVNTKVMANEMLSPTAQVGVRAIFNPGDEEATIETRTEFFEDAEGEYFVSVWTAIKNIVGFQATRGENAQHKQILWESVTTSTFGDEIVTGNIATGSSFETSNTYTFGNFNETQLQVIAVIWKKVGEEYQFVNGNVTNEFIQLSSTQELSADVAEVSVQPNITSTNAQLLIDAKTDLGNTKVQLFNAVGQPVANIFEGQIFNGNYPFNIDRKDFAAGLYFIRIQSEKGIRTEKIIFQ
jgi:hypothetical protein